MSYYEEERDNEIISALKEISSQLVNIKKAIETKEDVVPVVRCYQCKHWNNGDCYRIELTRPNDYCSYGERKDENK